MKRRQLTRQILPIIALWVLLPTDAGAQERYPAESWMRYAVPEEAGWSSERIAEAKAFADSIGTAAFMLVHDGTVVATFGDYARRYQAHSVRKSLLSGLYGIYVAEGRIDLESTLADLGIDDRLPLTPMEKRARVVDLLTARSGVYHPAAYSAGRAATRPERGSHEPGTFWYYNNWDFNTLGEIFRRRTGLGVFDAFERRIADPLRMEDFRPRDGYYHWEPHHSNYPAYPFRMSARDLARFGLLFEREGRWEREQIIPASWIRESTRSYSEVDRPGIVGYGYMWSVLGGELGRHGAFAAMGVGAQTITVVPGLDIVFVHRVDTYVDGRVPIQAVLDLLDRLLDARSGEAGADPVLVRLEDPEPGAGLVRLPDELLQRYARTYTFPSGRTVDVGLRDGELVMHSDRLGTFGLLPLTDRQFLIEDAGMTAFFVPLSGGDSITFVQEMILRSEASDLLEQGRLEEAVDLSKRAVEYYPASAGAQRALGRVLLASGDSAAATASYRRSFELDPGDLALEFFLVRLAAEGFETVQPEPEVLDAYVGRYRIREGDTLTISRDGQRLLAAPPGVAVPQTLVATSDTVFFLDGRAGPVKLVFTPGESGRISGVRILFPDGRELRAEKIGAQDAEVPRTRTLPGIALPAFPYAQPEEVGLSSEKLERLGEEIVAWVENGDLVGGELLIIKDGRAVFHEAYGWSDRERRIPVERNSIWSIKSMSKPFTATAVLMLVDEGRLSLDDPISRYVPGFAGDPRTTIRHLLSHTSGYREEVGDPSEIHESFGHWVEEWAAHQPTGTLGEFRYTDFGFGAAGYIVEAVSGLPIGAFTEEHIAAPLGLEDTSTEFSDDPAWRTRLNPWYRWNDEAGAYHLRWTTDFQGWRFYPAAWGMFSTAMDYAGFMAMWMNKGEWDGVRLLAGATAEDGLREHARDGWGGYGYGWFVEEEPRTDGMPSVFFHGGGDGTMAMALPEVDAMIIFLTHSRYGPHMSAMQDVWGMLEVLDHPGLGLVRAEGRDLETADLAPAQRARYVGTYADREEVPRWVAHVTEEGGVLHLRITRPGGRAAATWAHLVPLGDDRFAPGRYDEGGRLLAFHPAWRVELAVEDDQATQLRIVSRGDTLFAARRADADRVRADAAARRARISAADILEATLEREGSDAVRDHFRALLRAAPDSVRINQVELNTFGYRLLRDERLVPEAIAVFELVVEAFPEEPNAHDSLGDAYRAAARLEEAKRSYERAVELAERQGHGNLHIYRFKLERLSQRLERRQ